jgi:hypothetical protein
MSTHVHPTRVKARYHVSCQGESVKVESLENRDRIWSLTGMSELGTALVAGVLSGSVIAAVLGLLTRKQSLTLEATIQDNFRRHVELRESQWALLQQVLGPVCAHLHRTSLAFDRWHNQNLFLEQEIIAESNREIRRVILDKYHLLTPDLRGPAMKLVQHYDRWFEEFERQRRSQNPQEGSAEFVFAGPQGYPFPKDAERAFVASLDATYDALIRAT